MKLGFSTDMFSDRPRAASLPGIQSLVETVARSGAEVIDLSFRTASGRELLADDGWESAVDAAANAAAKQGVPIVQVSAPFDPYLFLRGAERTDDDAERAQRLCRRAAIAAKRIGAAWLVVRPFSDTIRCEYDPAVEIMTNREFYAPVLEDCQAGGVGLAYENVCNYAHFDLRRVFGENTDDLIALVDSYSAPSSVGVCWNFGYANFMIADQPRAIRKMGSRIKTVHASDNRGDVDMGLIPFVGGNVKWEKVIPALREIGYAGDLIIDAPSFTRDFPDALMPDAVGFALEAGRFLLAL